ncbi:MAG: DUF2817 domain-containing protein [Bdellovibrionaceae bacterium]|nr:DUF2817 domain-containing protein [Pseudobdellovibrionaceae bacterium]
MRSKALHSTRAHCRAPQNPSSIDLTIVPEFNIDGILLKTRGNRNGVDLNRNLPTKDWSPIATTPRATNQAPSSQRNRKPVTGQFIETEKPIFIISLHSWKPLLNINEPPNSTLCHKVASRIASFTGDIIEPTIGYSTPGCLGTYAGLERGIPTITYEIERGMKLNAVVQKHLSPLLEGLKVLEA